MAKSASPETVFHWINDAAMPSANEQRFILKNTLLAATANTNPYQSGYHVRSSAMDEFGQLSATGGNREKTLTDAWIHGETSAINNFRSRFGEVAIKFISFYSESMDPNLLDSAPCGPCRDTILQETGRDTFMTTGNEDVIVVSRFSDYLKEDFTPISTLETHLDSVADGEIARFFSDYEYLPQDELLASVYGVVLLDQDGRRWRGGLETTAGYNEVSAGYAARIAWKQTIQPGETRADLERITVVRRWGLPTNIEYRDRQALLELDEVLMKKHGRTEHLRVDLVHVDDSGPVEAVTTNTAEWLPHPFSAASLGLPVPEQQAERLEYFESEIGGI